MKRAFFFIAAVLLAPLFAVVIGFSVGLGSALSFLDEIVGGEQ